MVEGMVDRAMRLHPTAGQGTPGRPKVHYFLFGIGSLGQLVAEMFWLRNIFDDQNYEFHIITRPPDNRVNTACYEFALRNAFVYQIEHYVLPKEHRGIYRTDDSVHVMETGAWLEHSFPLKLRDRPPSFYHRLTEQDLESGRQLRQAFGIPLQAPIVTIHNREQGWRPDLAYHGFRNARIEDYVPAIDYLVRQGYYVVRLGDASMQRLTQISNRVIDAPFQPAYCPFADIYFSLQSKFMVSAPSGPSALAFGSNVRLVMVNAPIQALICANEGDLFVPKKYYSRPMRRYLTYSEIITSPLLEYYHADKFESFGVELHDNTPDELLRAVQEMDARLSGQYAGRETLDLIDRRVKTIQSRGHNVRKHTCPKFPFYPMYYSRMQISCEYLKANPWFLDERHWV